MVIKTIEDMGAQIQPLKDEMIASGKMKTEFTFKKL